MILSVFRRLSSYLWSSSWFRHETSWLRTLAGVIRHPVRSKTTRLVARAYDYYYAADYGSAGEICHQALSVEPENPDACFLKAELRKCSGDLQGACDEYRNVLRLKPEFVEAHINLGLTLRDQGYFDDAISTFERAIEIRPDSANLYNNLATVYMAKKEYGPAGDMIRKSLEIDSKLPQAYCNLGIVHQETGRFAAALDDFHRAIEIAPECIEAYTNIGLALKKQERYEEAEKYLRKAIELNPDSEPGHYNLGYVMLDLARAEEALSCFEHVLRIDDKNANAVMSCGMALRDLGEIDRAIEFFNRAIAIQPDHPEARLNRAYCLFLKGKFRQGWEDYEQRLFTEESYNHMFRTPRWDGKSVCGRKILIFAEQGLGDQILFASCLPDLIGEADECAIECDPRLVKLFQRSFPSATLRKAGAVTNKCFDGKVYDAELPMGSLPALYRNSFSDFPDRNGHLKADDGATVRWRRRLDELGKGLKVGISWRGGVGNTRRQRRSMDLSRWTPILNVRGAHFISLQYTECSEELDELRKRGSRIEHWQEAIDDYDETAALVNALDLVISVCTSVVSLSGALGKKVWVMVPSSPGWMYMCEGDDMPWFSSVRIFRQACPMEWDDVIVRIARELQVLINDR